MNNIILAITLIVAFFMCIKAYTLGLKHGKQLSNAIIPKLELNPIKPIIEAIDHHKESKDKEKLNGDLENIMGATKESMLSSIKAR